jgi:hypothetical protein
LKPFLFILKRKDMEPDEIIQQKEWYELTNTEKQSLHELAENEQEYNLLKKMMQVSLEEAGSVPPVSSSVREELAAMVQEQKPVSFRKYWYAAAAAVVAMIIAAIIIFPKKAVHDDLVKSNGSIPNDTTAIVKNVPVVIPDQPDTAINPSTTANISKAPQPVPVKPATQNRQADLNPDNTNNSYAAADVHVSDDAELVNLVTEIY